MKDETAVTETSVTEKDRMERLSEKIADLSTGDRALLRRLYLIQSSSSRSYQADGVVVGLLDGANIRVGDDHDKYEAWRLLTHVAALLSGTGKYGQQSHNEHKHVGEALQAAGYSENRLLRLTAARGPILVDQIVRAARVLARSDQGQGDRRAVNLWTLFDLVDPLPVNAKAARLQIAKHYYAAAARSGKGEA